MQIINELKRNWTDDSIDYWKALRELCLMRPTLSRKNVEHNSQYQLVYMCAPGEITAYSYEQEGDYNKNINIKFDGSLPQKMSEDEVHLKELMQIPGVKALFEKHGYATGFVPNEFISREEFAKLIVCAFDFYDETAECNFEDVKGDWSYKYVASLYNKGITSGMSESVFGKGYNITREDMAVLCANAASITADGEADFKDKDTIADYKPRENGETPF